MKIHYVSTIALYFSLFSFSQTSLGQFFDPGWGIYKPSDVKNLPGSACSRRLSTDPIAKYAMEGYIEATGNGYWVSCPLFRDGTGTTFTGLKYLYVYLEKNDTGRTYCYLDSQDPSGYGGVYRTATTYTSGATSLFFDELGALDERMTYNLSCYMSRSGDKLHGYKWSDYLENSGGSD